jgi:hypothetical protein
MSHVSVARQQTKEVLHLITVHVMMVILLVKVIVGSYCSGSTISQCPTPGSCSASESNSINDCYCLTSYSGSAACSVCPIGSYSHVRYVAIGSTSCNQCLSSYYNLVNNTCTDCPLGSYCDGISTLAVPCVIGYYCPLLTPQPLSCGTSRTTSTNGSASSSDCHCTSGLQGDNVANGACSTCTAGLYCVGNGSLPFTCPMNYYCPSGSSLQYSIK